MAAAVISQTRGLAKLETLTCFWFKMAEIGRGTIWGQEISCGPEKFDLVSIIPVSGG